MSLEDLMVIFIFSRSSTIILSTTFMSKCVLNLAAFSRITNYPQCFVRDTSNIVVADLSNMMRSSWIYTSPQMLEVHEVPLHDGAPIRAHLLEINEALLVLYSSKHLFHSLMASLVVRSITSYGFLELSVLRMWLWNT